MDNQQESYLKITSSETNTLDVPQKYKSILFLRNKDRVRSL